MPRVKTPHNKNFTVVQNNCIYDLTPFELGVLIKMLAKKDDFNFSVDRFAKEINETRQKTSKALKALEEAGYLYRKQKINDTKFGNMIYYVSDIPCLKNGIDNLEIEEDIENKVDNRKTENRSTESRTTGNSTTESRMTETKPTLLNTNISNTRIINTNKLNTKEINKEKEKKKPIEHKKQFAEAVYLTDSEYQTLCEKHPKVFVDKCINVLNNYKLSKGKYYKSDYHAILAWVEKKVQEDMQKLPRNQFVSAPIQTDPHENPFAKYLNQTGGQQCQIL